MATGTIAKAQLSDADAIATLVNSAYRGEYAKKGWTTESDLIDGSRTDADAIRELLKDPAVTILIYIIENKISGCVELKAEGKKLYLGMLTVDPSIQGGGIGKQMLKAADDFGKDQNCDRIYMSVITVRKELIDWYKRHGFSETGERKPFNFTDPRFGQPKKPLEFLFLEKKLS